MKLKAFFHIIPLLSILLPSFSKFVVFGDSSTPFLCINWRNNSEKWHFVGLVFFKIRNFWSCRLRNKIFQLKKDLEFSLRFKEKFVGFYLEFWKKKLELSEIIANTLTSLCTIGRLLPFSVISPNMHDTLETLAHWIFYVCVWLMISTSFLKGALLNYFSQQ